MVKVIVAVLALTVVSGCASSSAREARCSCFAANGDPTGNCDFERLAPYAPSYAVSRAAFQPTEAEPCDE